MRHGNLPVALEPSREKDGNFLRFCHSIFVLGRIFNGNPTGCSLVTGSESVRLSKETGGSTLGPEFTL
jgi:hypothetical protein